ncbi:ZNF451 isoform 13 [Pongo abelii]|uniref:ZNF451 isoform 13 n=1 Tax=Pongo abelii TaxID=9601 RepID=A0A2J8SST9_PONAB|nr:ZNF451 isoform 13 [Pongo abelii]
MGDPGSEIIESVPPAGPEASESTTDENEDDIQFVSITKELHIQYLFHLLQRNF